jgi:hypothetical protein
LKLASTTVEALALRAWPGLLDLANAALSEGVAGVCGQPAVGGQQHRVVERLGEREVRGVVGREAVTESQTRSRSGACG